MTQRFVGYGCDAEGEVLAYAGNEARVEGLALSRRFRTYRVSDMVRDDVLGGWRRIICREVAGRVEWSWSRR